MTNTPHEAAPDCVFCKIVNNEIPAVKIYEDEHTLAFLDIQPANFGHTLVIPKDHFENVYVVPAEEWCRLNLVAQKVALAVKNGADADGINLIMNNESGAGQIVPHAHIHVIPRYNEDGLKHWDHKTYLDAEQMKETSEKIKNFIE
jgi:histidine triad (HIT) family protein